jgi:hypothetical protein
MRGRDPRVGQLAGEQQPQLQRTVAVVGLRSPFAAASVGRLGRVAEPRDVSGTLDLLGDEPPTRRRLQHKRRPLARKLSQPFAQRLARGRTDAAATTLTTHHIQRPKRDLPTMYI